MGRAWLDRAAYPFGSRHFDVPAGRMHYVDAGQGRPIVLLHGNPTWSYLYRHLIRHLQPRYRCVAPDYLGFGLSDKPPDFSYHPRDHAANVAALIEYLDLEAITLVVHDWGGPIGLSYALSRPERIHSLVIMNTWMWSVARDPYYVAFSAFTGGPIGRFLTRRYNFFARVVMKSVYGDRSRLTGEIHRHYIEPLREREDRTGSIEFARQITASSQWLDQLWSRRSNLDAVPKLFVWGMKDPAFRKKELGRWTEALPGASVIRLPDVGHYVQEEAPERLAGAVDTFLSAAGDRVAS